MKNIIQIGDKATINIGEESRSWGYNPGPDGMEVEIIGWGEIPYGRLGSFGRVPGIYENHSWPIVRFPDGKETSISSCHLKSNKSFYGAENKRLRDLPETEFYEWDEVKVVGPRGYFDDNVVTGIDYGWMTQKRNDGSPMPHYRVSPNRSGGSYCSYGDSDLELVSRGPIWKYFHNEPVEFADEMEEIKFFYALYHWDGVRNPRCDLYSWTRDEIVVAARDGLCDCMNVSDGLFGGGIHLSAVKFRDRELGERARRLFLRGFSSCVKR